MDTSLFSTGNVKDGQETSSGPRDRPPGLLPDGTRQRQPFDAQGGKHLLSAGQALSQREA